MAREPKETTPQEWMVGGYAMLTEDAENIQGDKFCKGEVLKIYSVCGGFCLKAKDGRTIDGIRNAEYLYPWD